MSLEDRFQAILSKSNQIEAEKNSRQKIENDLLAMDANLQDIATRILEVVEHLVFTDLDNFLCPKGFKSSVNNNNGKLYKLDVNKQIEWFPTNTASKKIGFLVKQTIIESRDYRVEVSFKDPVVDSAMKTAKQGINITNNQSTEFLSDWLKRLEVNKNTLDVLLANLSLDNFTVEYFPVGSNHGKKAVTPSEALVKILEA
jgi:hypothetical protein